nr:hypothetical protein [uncultured bacterium]
MANSASIYPLKSPDIMYANCPSLSHAYFSSSLRPNYLGPILPSRSFHLLLCDELGLIYRLY